VNTTPVAFPVQVGDRIAQLILEDHHSPTVIPGRVDWTERGEGGFGSTGNR
jgi:dUTPase